MCGCAAGSPILGASPGDGRVRSLQGATCPQARHCRSQGEELLWTLLVWAARWAALSAMTPHPASSQGTGWASLRQVTAQVLTTIFSTFFKLQVPPYLEWRRSREGWNSSLHSEHSTIAGAANIFNNGRPCGNLRAGRLLGGIWYIRA